MQKMIVKIEKVIIIKYIQDEVIKRAEQILEDRTNVENHSTELRQQGTKRGRLSGRLVTSTTRCG